MGASGSGILFARFSGCQGLDLMNAISCRSCGGTGRRARLGTVWRSLNFEEAQRITSSLRRYRSIPAIAVAAKTSEAKSQSAGAKGHGVHPVGYDCLKGLEGIGAW